MINDSVLCGRQEKAKGRKVEEGSCCFAPFCFALILLLLLIKIRKGKLIKIKIIIIEQQNHID